MEHFSDLNDATSLLRLTKTSGGKPVMTKLQTNRKAMRRKKRQVQSQVALIYDWS